MEKIGVIQMSAKEYSALLGKEIGKEREDRSNVKIGANYPLSGTFAKIGFDVAKIGDVEHRFPVFIVIDESGTKLGTVAVNSVLQNKSANSTFQVKRETSDYYEQYGVKGIRVNEKFISDKSEAEIVELLLGKSYTAKKVPYTVPKFKFKDGKCLHFESTPEKALEWIEEKECFELKSLK